MAVLELAAVARHLLGHAAAQLVVGPALAQIRRDQREEAVTGEADAPEDRRRERRPEAGGHQDAEVHDQVGDQVREEAEPRATAASRFLHARALRATARACASPSASRWRCRSPRREVVAQRHSSRSAVASRPRGVLRRILAGNASRFFRTPRTVCCRTCLSPESKVRARPKSRGNRPPSATVSLQRQRCSTACTRRQCARRSACQVLGITDRDARSLPGEGVGVSIRNLDALLRPRSVAVVGGFGCSRARSARWCCATCWRGGFEGPILPVHPKHASVAGVLAYPTSRACRSASTWRCSARRPRRCPSSSRSSATRARAPSVVLAAGLGAAARRQEARRSKRACSTPRDATAARARPELPRPRRAGHRTATRHFAHVDALPGDLAFVSQSGAVCTVALDWARGHRSASRTSSRSATAPTSTPPTCSTGSAPIPRTRAILLYLESDRRRAQVPVGGAGGGAQQAGDRDQGGPRRRRARAPLPRTPARSPASTTSATPHCVAPASCASTRIDELFDAAETLARARPLRGDRVAMLSQRRRPRRAGGRSRSSLSGGRLAALATRDARGARRGAAGDLVARQSGRHRRRCAGRALRGRAAARCSTTRASTSCSCCTRRRRSRRAATRRAPSPRCWPEHAHDTRVLTSWPGRVSAEPARRILHDAGVATYDTPEDAIAAFARMLAHRRNQELLMEMPSSRPVRRARPTSRPRARRSTRRVAAGRTIAERGGGEGRCSRPSACRWCDARSRGTPTRQSRSARRLGFPVAVKLLSPDVTHKSDVGGVALDLATPQRCAIAARAMQDRLRALAPDAQPGGFTVQPMARRPDAHGADRRRGLRPRLRAVRALRPRRHGRRGDRRPRRRAAAAQHERSRAS